jgi:hypothetical protein
MEDFSDEASREQFGKFLLDDISSVVGETSEVLSLGVALGSTLGKCSINSLGTPGMSAGFHPKMSRLARRKLMSASSYFGSRPAPMVVVLLDSPVQRSIFLTRTSSGG